MSERDEVIVCGLAAVRAVIRRRPQEIVRVHLARDRVAELSGFLCWFTAEGRTYSVISDEVLARIAQTIHHEGVVMIVRRTLSS